MSAFKTSISIIALIAGLTFATLPQPGFAQDAGSATAAGGGQTAQQQLSQSVRDEIARLQGEIKEASKEIAKRNEELETEKANLRHFERVRDKETSHLKEGTKEPVPEALTPDEIEEGVTPQSGIEDANKEIKRLEGEIKKLKDANETRLTKSQEIIDQATGKTGGVQQAGGVAAQPGREKVCRNGLEDAAKIKEYRESLRQTEIDIADLEAAEIGHKIDRMTTAADRDLNAVTKQARLDNLDLRISDDERKLANLRITATNLRALLKDLLDIFCPPSPPAALPFPSSDAAPLPRNDGPKAKPIDKTETKTTSRPPARISDKKATPRDTEPQVARAQPSKPGQHPQQSGGDPAAAQVLGTAIGIGIGIGVGHAMGGERRMDDGMRMR